MELLAAMFVFSGLVWVARELQWLRESLESRAKAEQLEDEQIRALGYWYWLSDRFLSRSYQDAQSILRKLGLPDDEAQHPLAWHISEEMKREYRQ